MIEIALDAIKKAEKELLNFRHNPIIISEEKRDIKTKADVASNKVLYDILSKTNLSVIAEEIPSSFKIIPEVCWIIDLMAPNFLEDIRLCYRSLYGKKVLLFGIVKLCK